MNMNIISKISVTSLALGAALAAYAQATATSGVTGLLGHRYVEISAGAVDPHIFSETGLAAGTAVNLPVRSNLDLGFGYNYGRLDPTFGFGAFEQRSRDHALFATSTGYTTLGSVKPFLAAALGYLWSKNELLYGGTSIMGGRDQEAAWALSLGMEAPLGPVTLTPRVSYQDGFHRNSGTGFSFNTEASTWFTKSCGAFVRAAYFDPKRDTFPLVPVTGGSVAIFDSGAHGLQAWTYTLGARFRF